MASLDRFTMRAVSTEFDTVLKRLEIEGFKSFGSPPQPIHLSPLNFVVGPNASGKSNLLLALRFLQTAVRQDAEYAVNELGGAGEVRNKAQRQRQLPKPLRILVELDDEVTFSTPDTSGGESTSTLRDFRYTLELDLRTKDDIPVFTNEELSAQITHGGDSSTYQLRRTREKVVIDDPSPLATTAPAQDLKVPDQERARSAVGVGFFSFPAVVFKEIISHWNFFNISPRVAKQSYKDTPDATLGMYGENLAVVLHRLGTNNGNRNLSALAAGLRHAIPGLREICAVSDGLEKKWAVTIKEENAGKILPISISDGTIRLIALMTIATMQAESSSLIAVEEPENGVHPQLSEHLISVFREASQRKAQIIATTHNPSFLDFLEPQEVLLCGKIEGLTRIRRADDLDEVHSFKKHFSLGDLWVQGTFDQLFES